MAKSSRPLEKLEPECPDRETELRGALHEVSNALTVVIGWLNELVDGCDTPAQRDGLEVARRHARIGHRIAREAVGAPIAEGLQAQSVYELARDVIRSCSHEAARRGIRLRQHNLAPDAVVHDAEQALQILMNLMLNALSFSPEGGTVGLEVSRDDSMISFAVWDEGPGVPRELRPQIFAGGVSRRPGGAGIGLAYCYGLARTMGGELRLTSSPVGARFELSWPMGEARSTTTQRATHPSLLAGLRVVVLEDDPAVITLLELGLSAQGVEVISAQSEAELQQLLDQPGPIDAALVDLSPLCNPAEGIAPLEALGIPVVLMTGDSSSSDLDDRVAAYVRKPFEVSEVCEALRRVSRAQPASSA